VRSYSAVVDEPGGDLEVRSGAPASFDAHGDTHTDVARIRDFHDPAKEWRRLCSEVLGTFLLVLVAVGAGVAGSVSGVTISRAAAVTAAGLMVMAAILFMGKVGGAHLNPVVSVAFALRSEFPSMPARGSSPTGCQTDTTTGQGNVAYESLTTRLAPFDPADNSRGGMLAHPTVQLTHSNRSRGAAPQPPSPSTIAQC
jgi:hypothetical protein